MFSQTRLTHRPYWGVAGVDYYVGANPAGGHLAWRSNVPSGWTLNGGPGGNQRLDGNGCTSDIVGLDFTQNEGGYIWIQSGQGCGGKTVTIRNNNL